MKERFGSGTVFKCIGIVLLLLLLGAAALLGVLTVTEYRPEAAEPVEINGNASGTISEGDSFTIMTWNIGYGALGETADFFMDGGTHVMTASEEEIGENLEFCLALANEVDPDVIFFQEVDTDAKRSYGMDEEQFFADRLTGYQETFAYNYKCLYVPYPLPTIGKVNAGLLTLSSFALTSADRIRLPCPFSYPVRLCNLKRCLLVSRVALEGSDRELVLINLHLEAYDDGEGKETQTAMLREFLDAECSAGNYVIAGGDFNQVFSNVDTSMYPVVSADNWEAGEVDVTAFDEDLQFLMDNSVPTCRSLDQPYAGSDPDSFQYYMIDGFIVSANLTVESIETLDTDFQATDHNPVVMTVTLQ